MAPSFASLCNYNAMTYITIHVTSGAACIGEMGQPLALDEDLVQFFTRILRHFPLFRFYSSFFVLHHVMAMKVFPRDAMHSYVLSIVCFDRWTKTEDELLERPPIPVAAAVISRRRPSRRERLSPSRHPSVTRQDRSPEAFHKSCIHWVVFVVSTKRQKRCQNGVEVLYPFQANARQWICEGTRFYVVAWYTTDSKDTLDRGGAIFLSKLIRRGESSTLLRTASQTTLT